jgi:hypothetical protein
VVLEAPRQKDEGPHAISVFDENLEGNGDGEV